MGIKIFGLIFLVVGIIVVLVEINKKKTCTSVVIGKVVDISRKKSSSIDSENHVGSFHRTGEVHFYPIFEYTVDSNVYVKKSSSGSNSSRYFIGQDIEIYYNPSNPNKYYVKSNSISSIVLGVIFAIAGLLVMTLS